MVPDKPQSPSTTSRRVQVTSGNLSLNGPSKSLWTCTCRRCYGGSPWSPLQGNISVPQLLGIVLLSASGNHAHKVLYPLPGCSLRPMTGWCGNSNVQPPYCNLWQLWRVIGILEFLGSAENLVVTAAAPTLLVSFSPHPPLSSLHPDR